MNDKQCPRCGKDMHYNAIVMDYVCDHCQYLSVEAMERMAEEYERNFGAYQSVKKMMDTVDDEF